MHCVITFVIFTSVVQLSMCIHNLKCPLDHKTNWSDMRSCDHMIMGLSREVRPNSAYYIYSTLVAGVRQLIVVSISGHLNSEQIKNLTQLIE